MLPWSRDGHGGPLPCRDEQVGVTGKAGAGVGLAGGSGGGLSLGTTAIKATYNYSFLWNVANRQRDKEALLICTWSWSSGTEVKNLSIMPSFRVILHHISLNCVNPVKFPTLLQWPVTGWDYETDFCPAEQPSGQFPLCLQSHQPRAHVQAVAGHAAWRRVALHPGLLQGYLPPHWHSV